MTTDIKHICKYCKTDIVVDYVVRYHSKDLIYKLKCNCRSEFIGSKENCDILIKK